MENPYIKYLEELFKQLVLIHGQLLHCHSHISEYEKRFQSENFNFHEILGSTIAIRDFTIEKENEEYFNLHPVLHKYKITVDNIKKQNDRLVKKVCALNLSQAYESLEKFLNKVVTEFILINRPVENISDKLNANLSFEETKKALKKEKHGDNKYLLKIFRRNLDQFKNIELNNMRKINFVDWFDIYTQVRHAVTHNSQVINKNIVEKFHKEKLELFEELFPCIEKESGYLIDIDYNISVDIINLTAEYAFFVFKYLSIKNNFKWDYLKKFYKPNSNNR